MNNFESFDRRALLAGLGAVGALAAAKTLRAGDLNPPIGPVNPTMKPLDEVEPRIPISSLPFVISQPGSYYLTRNLTGVSGQHGITINANGVTLDLMGYSLTGVGGALNGVTITNFFEGIFVRNGFVRSWGQYGVDMTLGSHQTMENVVATSNVSGGVRVGSSSSLVDCKAIFNGGNGFETGGRATVINCVSRQSAQNGFSGGGVYESCTAMNNTLNGFNGSGNYKNCIGAQNQLHGYNGAGLYEQCEASNNASNGFNGTGVATYVNCAATINTGIGFNLATNSHIEGCRATNNGSHGISGAFRCTIVNNNCSSNGGGVSGNAGILLSTDSRVDGNFVGNNHTGIRTTTSGCYITRNVAKSNTTNYTILGGNTFGPIIVATGEITSTNPWANFSS